VTEQGKVIKGVRDADNPKVLKQILRRDGILVTGIHEQTASEAAGERRVNFKRWFNRVTTADLALATRQLATLLKSGIPVGGCSQCALIEQIEKPDLKAAFTQTRTKVNEGISLAEALGEHPKVFADLYVSMVAAGESSGTLEAVLARLAEFLGGPGAPQEQSRQRDGLPYFHGADGDWRRRPDDGRRRAEGHIDIPRLQPSPSLVYTRADRH
jgi:general secretion pathway protein F